MKFVIIDDEEKHRNLIKSILKEEKNLLCSGEATCVAEGLALIEETSPDLVLLDIDMPDGTGFDLLKSISPIDFQVVFITAHDEFAVKAFKFSALDYLLKPIDPEELLLAVQKAPKVQQQSQNQLQLATLLSNVESFSQQVKKLVLKDSDNIYIVSTQEILYLQAHNNYTSFFLTENRKIVVSKTLKEYEQLLENSGFFRTHQSYLINLAYLQRIDKREGGSIVLQEKIYLPLAQRRKDSLLKMLEK
ncbi:LytR/AlgR family response regulator transcription factor [Thermoflexibacter ruber]|uniref:Two component transcriptional regulator, LytTR family n=1 Tax=Thermoflexibacter ruber TaxID=1003 RepID=A0A1I2HMD6_9BACT|nr:LytTR family DNA-binding domain-containing protein [Thermoflexibacter ruber]SFF30017.1 two component transcriptional regulator, LytTR family [Thermoflexibacter ruber]